MTPKKLKPQKLEPIKGYALRDEDRWIYIYGNVHVYSTRKDALTAKNYYNGEPFNHRYQVIPVLITPIQHKPKTKKK